MSNHITMAELLERSKAYAADCADAYTKSTELRFNTHGCMIYPTKDSGFTVSMQGTPNDHALAQVVERLDGPEMRWIGNTERCPLELRARILNNLAANYRPCDNLFIRHKGESVRAVLSDQYTRFDNATFLDLVSQAVSTMGADIEVHRAYVGDELSAYLLIPSVTFDNDPAIYPGATRLFQSMPGTVPPTNGGDLGGLHPCIYISNSEIGTGKARTNGGLYRLVCSNGAIVGYKSDEALQIRHRYLTPGTMRAIIAQGIASALHMSEQAAIAYTAAQEQHLEPVNLKSIISQWATKYGLSVPVKDNWLAAVTNEIRDNARENDPRALDLFNAATFSAHTIKNTQERELVERMAGDYLMAATNTSTSRQARWLDNER